MKIALYGSAYYDGFKLFGNIALQALNGEPIAWKHACQEVLEMYPTLFDRTLGNSLVEREENAKLLIELHKHRIGALKNPTVVRFLETYAPKAYAELAPRQKSVAIGNHSIFAGRGHNPQAVEVPRMLPPPN